MSPFELRKVIQVGYRFAQPEAAPLLDREGLPLEPVKQPYTATIVFWIPAPQPFQRCSGKTRVVDARPFEVQALRDGAIVEHVQDFDFPEQPSLAELRHRLMAVWDGLTAQSLEVAFNNVPVDTRTGPVFQFDVLTNG